MRIQVRVASANDTGDVFKRRNANAAHMHWRVIPECYRRWVLAAVTARPYRGVRHM